MTAPTNADLLKMAKRLMLEVYDPEDAEYQVARFAKSVLEQPRDAEIAEIEKRSTGGKTK